MVPHVQNGDVKRTIKQSHLLGIVQAQLLFLFGHIVRMPNETNAKKILTASPGRTGGDQQDDLVVCG